MMNIRFELHKNNTKYVNTLTFSGKILGASYERILIRNFFQNSDVVQFKLDFFGLCTQILQNYIGAVRRLHRNPKIDHY